MAQRTPPILKIGGVLCLLLGSRPKVAVKDRPDPRFRIEQQAVAKYREGNLSPVPQRLQGARREVQACADLLAGQVAFLADHRAALLGGLPQREFHAVQSCEQALYLFARFVEIIQRHGYRV